MKDETAIALLIVLVIASAGAGYYVGSTSQQTTTIVSLINNSKSNSVYATCIQTASAPLYLIVKNDSGAPIPSQPLSIQAHLLGNIVERRIRN